MSSRSLAVQGAQFLLSEWELVAGSWYVVIFEVYECQVLRVGLVQYMSCRSISADHILASSSQTKIRNRFIVIWVVVVGCRNLGTT